MPGSGERAVPGHPEILLLSNLSGEGKPSGKHTSAYGWHIDGHYLAKPPAMYATIPPMRNLAILLGLALAAFAQDEPPAGA